PSSVIGRATPVSPRGTREGNVFVPATFNPSKFPHVAATASRSKSVRQAAKVVHHSGPALSHPVRQAGGPRVAAASPSSTNHQPRAMGALGTLDQALDQLGSPS